MPGEQIEDDSWDGQYEIIAQHIKRASSMNNHCPAAFKGEHLDVVKMDETDMKSW